MSKLAERVVTEGVLGSQLAGPVTDLTIRIKLVIELREGALVWGEVLDLLETQVTQDGRDFCHERARFWEKTCSPNSYENPWDRFSA